jgi:DNA repair exonuclease SbcCD ATPase subunit
MTTYKPGEFLIFMDSSLELNTFKSLDLGTKTGLKDQFLCTDIESGIARMITPYEELAAKEAEEAKKAQLEAEEMASYKQKYEDAKSQLDATDKENNNLRKAYTEEKSKVAEMTTKLSEFESTITELRTALQSAADKIESMKNEFNGVCKKFGLTRKCTEGSDPEWSQDPNAIPKYVELLNQYQDKVTELSSTKSELDTKSHDYDQLKLEFENYKKSWTLIHDDLMEVQKQFGIYKDDSGKWCMIQDEGYEGDSDTTAAEVDEVGDAVSNAVIEGNAPKEITK